MSGAEQFSGKPRPDQKGQQQEKRVTMSNISFVVLETFGGLKQGSNVRQAFELFTKRALAKKIFDNSMGSDAIANQKRFEEADSAVTAAKADIKLNLAL